MKSFKVKMCDNVPVNMDEGTIYLTFALDWTGHLCPCGCGRQMIIPLDDMRKVTIHDDGTVTFFPSFKNYKCWSQYVIDHGEVSWR